MTLKFVKLPESAKLPPPEVVFEFYAANESGGTGVKITGSEEFEAAILNDLKPTDRLTPTEEMALGLVMLVRIIKIEADAGRELFKPDNKTDTPPA